MKSDLVTLLNSIAKLSFMSLDYAYKAGYVAGWWAGKADEKSSEKVLTE